MSVTELKHLRSPIVAICNDGTYVYMIMREGVVYRYAISGGTTTLRATLPGEIHAADTDGTYLYVAFENGRVRKYTLADFTTVSTLGTFGVSPVKSLTYYNNLVYVGLENGKMFSLSI